MANAGDFCAGTDITFSGNNSSFLLGEITGYQWSFGQGATPSIGSGVGPHEVTYETPGEKNVVLTVETDLGCLASDIQEAIVVIESCCEDLNAISGSGDIQDNICGLGGGAINLTVESNSDINRFEWSTNANTEDLSNIPAGNYSVTVTNLAACQETFAFTVDSVPPFQLAPNLTAPTCGGGMDGAIELIIQNGAEPLTIDFGDGPSQNNILQNLAVGNYPVTVTDVNGCSGMDTIRLNELELSLIHISEPTRPY